MGVLSTTQLEMGAFLSCVEIVAGIVTRHFSCEVYLESDQALCKFTFDNIFVR